MISRRLSRAHRKSSSAQTTSDEPDQPDHSPQRSRVSEVLSESQLETNGSAQGDANDDDPNTFNGRPLAELFPPEARAGWRGYVEWELAPERKRLATALLKTKKFTPIPGESKVVSAVLYASLVVEGLGREAEGAGIRTPQTNPESFFVQSFNLFRYPKPTLS